MKIKPLHNNIVIKQTDNTEEMYGNILIPDMGKEKPLMGELLAQEKEHITWHLHKQMY